MLLTMLSPLAQQPLSTLRIQRRTTLSALFVSAALLSGCQADSVIGTPRANPNALHTLRVESTLDPAFVVNQLSPVNVALTTSPKGVDILADNDFLVPKGQAWHVNSIVLRGFIDPKFDPTLSLHLALRVDSAGLPGSVFQSYTLTPSSVTPVSGNRLNDYQFDLPATVDLFSGRYWVETQCTIFTLACGMGPVIGKHSLGSTDGGITFAHSPFDSNIPDSGDLTFALAGNAETAATATQNLDVVLGQLGIPSGLFTRLDADLDNAQAALLAQKTGTACKAFQDFVGVATAEAGRQLTIEQATILIKEVNRISRITGC